MVWGGGGREGIRHNLTVHGPGWMLSQNGLDSGVEMGTFGSTDQRCGRLTQDLLTLPERAM